MKRKKKLYCVYSGRGGTPISCHHKKRAAADVVRARRARGLKSVVLVRRR